MKIKVKIAVVVDEQGNWSAAGWNCGKTSDDPLQIARDGMPGTGEERGYWVTAELDVPQIAEVPGCVECVCGERDNEPSFHAEKSTETPPPAAWSVIVWN